MTKPGEITIRKDKLHVTVVIRAA